MITDTQVVGTTLTEDTSKYVIIQNARTHNLKNLSVAIPRNKLVVVTGLSGSGKSSLIFDTLFAEGQRRYVESLSSYARQFLNRMKKPEVDAIKGLAPAMAIEQKVSVSNPRSTVGTSTEIYDYLKLLFARAGKTYSPVSGLEVKIQTNADVVNYILAQEIGTKVEIMAPIIAHEKRETKEELAVLLQKGFSRLKKENELLRIQDLLDDEKSLKKFDLTKVFLLIDRFIMPEADEAFQNRVSDSVQTAFYEGHENCFISVNDDTRKFSSKFELDNIQFEIPSVNLFTFSNPYGACKRCEGLGSIIGIDEDLVFPDKSLSVFEGVIAPWRSEKMNIYQTNLIKNGIRFNFPVHRPYYDLTEAEQKLLWTGNSFFEGLDAFFDFLEQNAYKIQYRVMLSRYRGRTVCPDCKGTRLRKDAGYVKIGDPKKEGSKSIIDVSLTPIDKLYTWFEQLTLDEQQRKIANRILKEVVSRLKFLQEVGLGYLTLNRLSNSLSGGESQRIKLATSLGSSLVGSLYILDEPSIGLHPRDNERLVGVLKYLRDLGNTVIVVEHEESVMQAADEIIDIGPLAGIYGGTLVFQGTFNEILKSEDSLTGKYLSGRAQIEIPTMRRPWKKFIEIKGARENNLKNVDVKFPLHTLTVVTGVSGSGKTSLVKKVLYPALKKIHGGYGEKTGAFSRLEGDYNAISHLEIIDQNPIGKSTRSNPVTYTKAYDLIRNLYADQGLSLHRQYKPATFSFNVEGGRCETCKGEGIVKVEMQFLADVELLCDECGGKRFKPEVLEVTYHEKNIFEVLELSVTEALDFFKDQKNILQRLKPLADVGLGYVALGQASSTLSGGEAQRIKLASYLIKGNGVKDALFIFDEPTTGLHFDDIKKLMFAFNALIEQGNSLIVIEHNQEVIKCADWVIDLGAEGGDAGGHLVFEGTPEDLVRCKESYTGQYLAEKF